MSGVANNEREKSSKRVQIEDEEEDKRPPGPRAYWWEEQFEVVAAPAVTTLTRGLSRMMTVAMTVQNSNDVCSSPPKRLVTRWKATKRRQIFWFCGPHGTGRRNPRVDSLNEWMNHGRRGLRAATAVEPPVGNTITSIQSTGYHLLTMVL